jgi:hypothetical protein
MDGPYHLEVLDIEYCSDSLLEIFSRAHMTYINQIFGDETIRGIIQEVYKKRGKLVIHPSGPEFENSVHHVYYYDSEEEPDEPVFDREGASRENLLAATSPRNNGGHNVALAPSPRQNAVARQNVAVLPPSPRGNVAVLPPSPRQNVAVAPRLRNLPPLPPSPRNNLSVSPRNNVSVLPPLPPRNGTPRAAENAMKSNNNVVRNVLNNMVTKVAANAEDEEEEDEDGYTSKICSVEQGYQDLDVDINDTLCQSYSLMTMLDIEFDSRRSAEASREQKYSKHLSMINMYRKILGNRKFRVEFGKIVRDPDNLELWEDTVDDAHEFFIIREFRTPAAIIDKIMVVLDIWERWGWQFFVGDGTCEKLKKDGGKRKTRRRNRI